jgi:hypothetical protein
MSQAAISRIERDLVSPSIDTLASDRVRAPKSDA